MLNGAVAIFELSMSSMILIGGVLVIEVDLNLPSARVICVLERIVAWRGFSAQILMENGHEFISVTFAEWAQKHDVHLEFIEAARPMQNCLVECVNCSRREGGDMSFFKSLHELKERIELWMNDCNGQCSHDSLNGMNPVEYRLFNHPQNSSNTWH
jgi:putative transposase